MYRCSLRNLKGLPVVTGGLRYDKVVVPSNSSAKIPGHHIAIVDRSGSMWGSMEELRATLEKLFTLQEFQTPDLRVSLVSYSSQGDCIVHFERALVENIVALNSPQMAQVRSLRPTGLTCISQALKVAKGLVRDNEVTGITLHSDGYANDRSPTMESNELDKAAVSFPSTVFCNTIAYSDWCDFGLLSRIANTMGGSCVRVKSARQVQEAFEGTMRTLAGKVVPAVTVALEGSDYLAIKIGAKVLGSTKDIVINGVEAGDTVEVVRLFNVGSNVSTPLPVEVENIALRIVARAYLAEGKLIACKQALVSARSPVIQEHYRALAVSDVATLAEAIDASFVNGETPTASYGVVSSGPTVIDVVRYVTDNLSAFKVHMPTLRDNYKRRGLKKVAGVRQADGSLTAPRYELVTKKGVETSNVGNITLNRSTATVNILLTQKADLVDTETGEVIKEVAGVPLNLSTFNNYTIVGDGVVTLAVLPLVCEDERVRAGLCSLLGCPTTLDAQVNVPLAKLPVVSFGSESSVSQKDVSQLFRLMALGKILNAALKGKSDTLTAEQIAELAKFNLTPGMSFSPPTTNDYTDLTEALNTGKVDTRVGYTVDIGNTSIAAPDSLPSANAFLERRFTCTVDGVAVEKPKATDILNPKAVWGVKELGKKVKLTEIDDFLFPIFEEFLGINKSGIADLMGARDEEMLQKLQKKIEAQTDVLYDSLSEVVFYIGATGSLPDSIKAEMLTADEIQVRFPTLKLSKNAREEGTFFVLPDSTLITVYRENQYFTVA